MKIKKRPNLLVDAPALAKHPPCLPLHMDVENREDQPVPARQVFRQLHLDLFADLRRSAVISSLENKKKTKQRSRAHTKYTEYETGTSYIHTRESARVPRHAADRDRERLRDKRRLM